MKTYTNHPVTEIFPRLSDEEFVELVASLRTKGLLQSIVVHGDCLLDGRERLRACAEAGVEPTFIEWQGSGDPSEWIIANNLHRRHLTPSQRALIAVDLKKHFEHAAEERRRLAPSGEHFTERRENVSASVKNSGRDEPRTKGKAAEHAARVTGVSPRSVETASKLVAMAAPELVAAVRAGDVSVSAAAEIAKLPPDAQRENLRDREKKKATSRLRLVTSPSASAQPSELAPTVAVSLEDALPLNLVAFKAEYKKGPPPSKRQPVHEVARLQQIAVTAALVERAWGWMNVEWESDGRADMVFALDEAKNMTPVIKEFVRRLTSLIERCTTANHDSSRPASKAGR